MRILSLAALTLVAAAFLCQSAAAKPGSGPLETYEARLSGRDHYNSSGVALTTAPQILRQDRANFHEFGLRDREDQSDSFFRLRENRARMEQLLSRPGAMSPQVRRRIVNDDPVVIVEVYPDWVRVTLKYP
ncbi:MAG: hypothetical protein U1E50_13975 [Caulobacteraceae bacterium]